MNTTITLGQVYSYSSYRSDKAVLYRVIKANRRTVIVEALVPLSDGLLVQLGMRPSQFKNVFKLIE
jgi:hypothetical protein